MGEFLTALVIPIAFGLMVYWVLVLRDQIADLKAKINDKRDCEDE